jgi:hypothetical protein
VWSLFRATTFFSCLSFRISSYLFVLRSLEHLSLLFFVILDIKKFKNMRVASTILFPLTLLSAVSAISEGPNRLDRRAAASASNTVVINSVDDYCLIVCFLYFP